MANPTQLFRRNATWRKQVARNLTTEVIVHGKIQTTVTRAKEIRRHVDKMITKAKKNTLASRRQAESFLRDIKMADGKTTAAQHLFKVLGPQYKDRNGGYTRIIKLPSRQGDNTTMALLELV